MLRNMHRRVVFASMSRAGPAKSHFSSVIRACGLPLGRVSSQLPTSAFLRNQSSSWLIIVGDGKGMLYVVMQDAIGSVIAVNVNTMKAVAHYSFIDKGGCNGLALDVSNQILFAACRSGSSPGQQPSMLILSAKDGRILANPPLAGGSDGAAFNPATMEAFSTQGNGTMTIVKEKSPTSFEVEQNLQTMNGARTITLDTRTGQLFTMSQERGPAPPASAAPDPGGRPPQGAPVPGSFTILAIGKTQ